MQLKLDVLAVTLSKGGLAGTDQIGSEISSPIPGLTIGFGPTNYTVGEGGQAVLRIVKVGEADHPVSVDLSTVDGTAVGEAVYSESTRRKPRL